VLLEPLANTRHRTFVGIGRGVRPVKNANFFKHDNSHAAAFALTDLCAKFQEKCFNVSPLNVGARRSSVDKFKRALMPFASSEDGTKIRY